MSRTWEPVSRRGPGDLQGATMKKTVGLIVKDLPAYTRTSRAKTHGLIAYRVAVVGLLTLITARLYFARVRVGGWVNVGNTVAVRGTVDVGSIDDYVNVNGTVDVGNTVDVRVVR